MYSCVDSRRCQQRIPSNGHFGRWNMSRRFGLIAALALLVASGCAQGQSSTGATGSPDKVKIGTSLAFSGIDPQGPSGSTFWSQIFYGNVVETLTTLDGQTSNVHPDL